MELSVVEQRYRAVLAVVAGESVVQVAAQWGVSRQTVHTWVGRYRESGLAGLADRSRRPVSCPHQVSPEVEVAVCELRRGHPGWGPRRIAHELHRAGVVPVPSRMTVHRVLVRHGLIDPRRRGRRRSDYRRWQRDAPMMLWQLDIVSGVMLTSGVEVKVVTGVDDHSRFCVLAAVVPRATGRAVCAAFAEALQRFGIPEEVLTDNGKQFTDRFGKGGEVLFDRICRDNGITHRLTQPASPTTTGKIERFHGSLRRELLDDHEPFESVLAAQAAVESWVADYNCSRPHQALEMSCPADRFVTSSDAQRQQQFLPLRLPPVLTAMASTQPTDRTPPSPPVTAGEVTEPETSSWQGGPVAFDRIVPASGNLMVRGKQFWLGPSRAGITVTFWANTDVIHLLIAAARVKTVRSHLSTADLAALAAQGGRDAGPPPLPPAEEGAALEVDRTVTPAGIVTLAGRAILAAEILGGRRVGIRIETNTLHFFDPDTRDLLRTRPNPLTYDQARRLRGARPAGPPPRPSTEPARVQRKASNSGVIMVVGQKIALGRTHAHQIVTIHVSDTTLTIDLDSQDTHVVRRTTTQPVRNIKAARPRKTGNQTHVS